MDKLYAPQDLGDGLVLRWSTPDDIEQIGTQVATVFRQSASDPPREAELLWIKDLSSGRHPMAEANGGLLVEDTRNGTIAASLWTMRAPWRYGDVTFEIGRPEDVITDPAYRNRGLVRALFERFHAWSEQKGHLAQGITGIEYFYRQFGYEYAIDLGGSCVVMFGDIPALSPKETELLTLRPATADDLPLIQQWYTRSQEQSLVSSDVPLSYWQWMLDGVDHAANQSWRIVVVVNQTGTLQGAFVLSSIRWGTALAVQYALWADDQNLLTVVRPVLRALRAYAPGVPSAREPTEPDRISFSTGTKNRFLDALTSIVPHQIQSPYAWYVRVPDLPRFIMTIAPVLEQRLRGSAVAGFDGELRLHFYRDGLIMKWQQGRLLSAESWRRVEWGPSPHASFPPQVFLQMLLGRRSLEDLRYAYADVSAERSTELVLHTLFPKQASHVLVLN